MGFQSAVDGRTLLHGVAANGYVLGIRCLIEEGMDVNGRFAEGFTPLHVARTRRAVNALINRGADINARDDRGRTPLHLNVVKNNQEEINALLDRGVEINARDGNGKTPLHLAAEKGFVFIAKDLIERGADVNARDDHMRNPLHYAAINGCVLTLIILIFSGAKSNARDIQGKTPLFMAVEFGHEHAPQVLIIKTLTDDYSAQKPNYLKDASSTYWDKCKNEIERKIGNSNISYLEFLKAGENKVVKYIRNHEIRNVLNDLDYGQFRIFGSTIKAKFCKGIERRELIDDGKVVIERFHCGSNINLNSDVSEKIAFYLPNSDLKKLKEVGDNNKNDHVEPSTKMEEMGEEQFIAGNERKMRIKKRTHQQAFLDN